MKNYLSLSKARAFHFFLFVCVLPVLSFAQNPYELRYQPRSLTGFYDVNDTNSLTVIDKINDFAILQDVLYIVHEIEDDANNRVHFEFHLAGGANYNFDLDTIGLVGAISFKVNLCNPKIPNAPDILANINKLHNLVSMTGCSLPEITSARLDVIEQNLKKYNSQFWWKRVSVGVSVPFIETNSYDRPRFNYKDAYLFIGYDLGDVITFQAGMNGSMSPLLAASVDLSTPLYSLAVDFKDMISRLLRLPERYGSYYW